MSRLQDIENNLLSINDAVFQELCDCFLSLRNDNYKAFSRIGSQIGKQKTIKGTPDTFLLLPNGKYIFVEYSTNSSKGFSKLKEDIEKCFDVKRTNISLESIDEIIICINFKLNTNELNELSNLLSETEISLDLYTLDRLALELNLHHRNLVSEYLGLHLDTGQIVSIDTFINEYNKAAKGIATPLDNPFLHRKNELNDLKKLIYENDIVILQGAPGVGKTKLALETMNEYINENTEYNAFCISYKSTTLLEDLYQYFDLEKNYILFVDDANRIDTFSQILGFLKTHRTGKLKIIITVRDYAFNILMNICQDFLPEPYKVNKLTDEQIIDIIKEEPFDILNYQYHNEIVRIADGNPRLAIMAALLAKEKQLISALLDVSDLFERYFSTFIKDKKELEDPNNIKILGLISFFYVIPFKNIKLTSNILNNFELDYNMFINNIDQLDNLELVNIQYEYVKIPEQNMATFFFYKAFIKDKLLSFSTLIEKYFENNTSRFKDCIIPANNTFGYQNVIEKLQPILINYWSSINNNENKAFNFLSIFWFYLQNETLGFIYKKIMSIPLIEISSYELEYNENKISHQKNEVLEILENFYHSSNYLKSALELSFEYIRRSPTNFSELINNINKSLIFDINDEYYDFIRQFILFELLINGLNNKEILFTNAFCELSKTFLKFSYHHTKGGRHNTITFYNYPFPNNTKMKDFRRNIWESMDINFSNNVFGILQEYLNNRAKENNYLMQYDIQYLVNIIEKHLKPDVFEHCKYVQEQIYWCKREEVDHPDFFSLRSNFRNHLYEMYLIIDRNKYYNNDILDFVDFREYERLKEAEIRSRFIFDNVTEIKTFYKDFLYICNIEQKNNTSKFNYSLDIIIDENYIRNFDLGCHFLIEVIENNFNNYIPNIVFRNHLVLKEKTEYIWNLIQSKEFQYKSSWELMFFENIPIQLATEKYITYIKNCINNINYYCNIFFDKIQKFQVFDKKLLEEVLIIIVNKNESEGKIYLWYDTFEKYFEQLGDDIELIKKAYLQQVLLEKHFDYEKNGLLKIISKDNYFLFEYVCFISINNPDKYHIDNDHELVIIWLVDNIETVLVDIFDLACKDDNHFDLLNDICKSFFYNLKEDQKERAKNFLFDYCRENYNNSNKISLIVDIIRHTMNEYYNEVLLYFLSFTQDKDLFSKISWNDDVTMTFSRDTIHGDIDASRWRNILSIVDKSDLGIKLIPIKQYINSKIEFALKRADYERKMKYLEDW
jgi:hypothetical protein